MNSLSEEYEKFIKFKTKTTEYIEELRDTLRDKCPDLYIKDSVIVDMQKEVDELEKKKNEMVQMTKQSLIEYKELEDQFEMLKLAQD